jgi:hypothetical protein
MKFEFVEPEASKRDLDNPNHLLFRKKLTAQ